VSANATIDVVPKPDEVVLEIDGREVRVTSPDKIFFSERGQTKLDLINFYLAIGEPLMRAMGGRPVLMQRFPEGPKARPSFKSACRNRLPIGWKRPSSARPTARRRTRSSPPISRTSCGP
jgi:DNA primase